MPSKKDAFSHAATRKGFTEKRSGHHIFYQYETPDGKLCPEVDTYMSHGSGNDLSDPLLSSMRRQMKFDKLADVLAFIECTFSKEEYFDLLKRKGLIE